MAIREKKFKEWIDNHPFIKDELFYPEGKACRWGRLIARWNERQDEKTLKHRCAFIFDLSTGNVYQDCGKSKIWIKCVCLTLAYPTIGFIKTLYHLILPISIPIEIIQVMSKGMGKGHSVQKIAHKACRNVVRSLADSIRTPLYTISLSIVSIAAVIMGLLVPRKLYDLRALAGRLEKTLHWKKKYTPWMVASCFQTMINIQEIHQYDEKEADTDYDDNPTLHGLNNLARAYVRYRRRECNLFNDCGQLLDHKTPYRSPIYQVYGPQVPDEI